LRWCGTGEKKRVKSASGMSHKNRKKHGTPLRIRSEGSTTKFQTRLTKRMRGKSKNPRPQCFWERRNKARPGLARKKQSKAERIP